jgi:hypothetical protein
MSVPQPVNGSFRLKWLAWMQRGSAFCLEKEQNLRPKSGLSYRVANTRERRTNEIC